MTRNCEPLGRALARKVDEIAELCSGEEDNVWLSALSMLASRIFICVPDQKMRIEVWELFRDTMDRHIRTGEIETFFERRMQ